MKEGTIENKKLYEVEEEDGTLINTMVCEEMEHCHFFQIQNPKYL